MMKKVKVFFFSNGNTAVCGEDGQQIPELQESWLLHFMKFLGDHGVDIEQSIIDLPDGSQATLFKTDNGHNWRIR